MKTKLLSLFTLLSLLIIGIQANAKEESAIDAYEEIDNSIIIDRIGCNDIEVTVPSLIFTFKEVEVKIKFVDPEHTKLVLNQNKLKFIINGEERELNFVNGESSFNIKFDDKKELSIYIEDFSFTKQITAYPLWAFLVPIVLIVGLIILRFVKK